MADKFIALKDLPLLADKPVAEIKDGKLYLVVVPKGTAPDALQQMQQAFTVITAMTGLNARFLMVESDIKFFELCDLPPVAEQKRHLEAAGVPLPTPDVPPGAKKLNRLHAELCVGYSEGEHHGACPYWHA